MTYTSCPFCCSPGQIRLDKRGRPYWNCPCGARIFMHGDTAILGFFLISGMVGQVGKERWTQQVDQARNKAVVPMAGPVNSTVAVPVAAPKVSKVTQSVEFKEVTNERIHAAVDRK